MGMRHAAVVAGLALGLMSGTAQAAPIQYNYMFNAGVNVGGPDTSSFSGTLTVDDGVVLDIMGSGSNIGVINNIIAPGGFLNNTNTLVDGSIINVSFNTSLLGNVLLDGGSVVAFTQESEFGGTLGNFTISAVPLPSSAPMFGAALLALGAIGYGVKRKKAAATA